MDRDLLTATNLTSRCSQELDKVLKYVAEGAAPRCQAADATLRVQAQSRAVGVHQGAAQVAHQ